jgi:hypothetical protein
MLLLVRQRERSLDGAIRGPYGFETKLEPANSEVHDVTTSRDW